MATGLMVHGFYITAYNWDTREMTNHPVFNLRQLRALGIESAYKQNLDPLLIDTLSQSGSLVEITVVLG